VVLLEINQVYKMDNLELMKQLENGSVNLIYCDILYNTGKKFKDFDDKLGTPAQAIEWYKPRIMEMKRVLNNKGSVYLQCDYRLVHYLKVLLDEIFGYKNFLNEIIWCYTGASNIKNKFVPKHDNILVYTKSSEYVFNFDDVLLPYSEETLARTKRNSGTNGLYKDNDSFLDKHKNRLSKGGKVPEDWWTDVFRLQGNSLENTKYSTQKPKTLLERIIKASSNEGDLVADFFCGSGTSLVVAKELKRDYIGCDLQENAIRIANERLHALNQN
jgi:site-specific DNA-methyltransferase (adenine-specific)